MTTGFAELLELLSEVLPDRSHERLYISFARRIRAKRVCRFVTDCAKRGAVGVVRLRVCHSSATNDQTPRAVMVQF